MIYVVSGPSCAGKTTLIQAVSEAFPDIHIPVSCTSKRRGAGEVDGRDYHFIERARLESRIKAGHFAEWAEVHGELYGILKIDLDVPPSVRVCVDIDIQGMRQVKEKFPRVTTIFILPPSFEILESRIRKRGRGETEEEIVRRLERAREEIACADEYDYRITSGNLGRSFEEMLGIMGFVRAPR